MNNKLFFLLLIIILPGCSKDETDEQPPKSSPPETGDNYKFISEIGGSDNTTFIYKDNLLLKGWEQNKGIFFEVEYNSQKKVQKVYTCKCGSSVNGSTLNIRKDFPEDYLTFEYFYANGHLSEIKSRSGKVLTRLKYDSNNRVTEYYSALKYCDDYDYYQLTKYTYDSSGAVESYSSFDNFSEKSKAGEIQIDDKINPLNVIWKKFGLIIPEGISQISNHNLPFFENNILAIYDSNELVSQATIKYEEDYPVYYKESSSQENGTTIKY